MPSYDWDDDESVAVRDDWRLREAARDAAFSIATPGALTGALLDLFERVYAGKGWRIDFTQQLLDEESWTVGLYRRVGGTRQIARVSGTGPTLADALYAAMMEIERGD